MLTLLVSVFGYLRDASLAARFGVSPTVDAYFGAIFVPSNLYLILVVGTLSPIFIPILLQEEATEDRAAVVKTFSVVTSFIFLIMVMLVTVGMVTAHKWLPLFFPGFDGATSVLALRLTYIILPAIVFLALAGIFTSVLNAYHKFALAAFAPAVSSITIISATVFFRGERAIYPVAIATTVGFVCQCLLLLAAVGRLGLGCRPIVDFRHPAIAKLVRLGAPILLYLGIGAISLLVERNLASRLSAGAVSAITYATRLFAVPSTFLAAPLAIVSYPQFARVAIQGDHNDLQNQISRTLRMIVFLFVPITIWIILNALPVTRFLYERGQFHAQDSVLISTVLSLYGMGILPNAMAIILIRAFYAIQDTVTPLIAESTNLVFYSATAMWLSGRFGIGGLAITRGLSFFLVAAIFVLVLWKRRDLLRLDLSFWRLFAQTAIATSAMAITSVATLRLLQPAFDSGKMAVRLCVMGIVLAASAMSFLVIAYLLKVAEARYALSMVMEYISRKDRATRDVYDTDRQLSITNVDSQ
jgi:putative peptidoglycan lipid II flippase